MFPEKYPWSTLIDNDAQAVPSFQHLNKASWRMLQTKLETSQLWKQALFSVLAMFIAPPQKEESSTHLKFNSSHLKSYYPKRKVSFQPSV